MRHNNQLPNAHLRKDWKRRVKTWFSQPGGKKSRRIARQKKSQLSSPRPVDGPLRPLVRCQTVKYNAKVRLGRGFTLDELKAAGLKSAKWAQSVGVAVDYRRRNRSVESVQVNVDRLKQFLSKLVVFTKKNKSAAAAQSALVNVKPSSKKSVVEAERAITAEEKAFGAYAALRGAYVDARLVGVRLHQAKAKAEAEEAGKK